MKWVYSLIMIINSALVFSANTGFPPYCQGLNVQQETLKLKTKQPVIVLIHNLGETRLWITHPVTNASASAGWSTQLDAEKWTALALDKNFELSCVESKPGHEQQVSCVNLISACQWKRKNVRGLKPGTFWLEENKDLNTLLAALADKGYQLPEL